MPNEAFRSLLAEKIAFFRQSFMQTAHAVFFDENAHPIHPGEYGTYREAIVREFIRFFVPGRLAIDTGFIVTGQNHISTQSDVIVFDRDATPLVESNERQRFFPIETVCAVGEVKSVLNKGGLIEALAKLARQKALREEVPPDSVILRRQQFPGVPNDFAPAINPYDHLPSFVICERFDFGVQYDITTLPNDLTDWYDNNEIAPRNRHNLVLSLANGLLLYRNDANNDAYYPTVLNVIHHHRLITPTDDSMSHIQLFCKYLFNLTSMCTVAYPDMFNYIAPIGGRENHDQE